MSLIEWLIAAAIVALLIVIGAGVYEDATSPTFELRKSDWKCAESHQETFVTHVLVGKVMVPQYHTETVCTNWVKR